MTLTTQTIAGGLVALVLVCGTALAATHAVPGDLVADLLKVTLGGGLGLLTARAAS